MPPINLTEAELNMLKEIVYLGLNKYRISRAYGITRHTINSHIQSIMKKTGTNNVTDAVIQALQMQVIPLVPDMPDKESVGLSEI